MMGSCATDPQCGWDTQGGWYDCGTSGGADPSGKSPKTCPGSVVTDAGPPSDQAAGNCGTVTDMGCCDGTVLKYCENGQLQTGDCAGSPSCGWDSQNGYYDCGTSGGADPSGKYPKACSAPTPDKGTTPAGDVFVPIADQSIAPTFDQGAPAEDHMVVTKKDGGNKKGGEGGCSCSVGGESMPTSLPLLLWALGGLLVSRRRR